MDTINLNIVTEKDLSKLERQKINSLKYVNSIKEAIKGDYLIISIPRQFFINNSYLVTDQDEVSEVIRDLKKKFEKIGHKVLEIKTNQVDYPFTFLTKEYESYKNFENVFNILTLNATLNKNFTTKFGYIWEEYLYQEAEDKASYYIHNSKSKNKSNIVINIYNQYGKIKEMEKEVSLNRFRDLKQRIRIEARLRKRLDISSTFLNLADVKAEAFKKIDEIMFKNMNQVRADLVYRLIKKLEVERNETNFNIKNFIRSNLRLILDFSILKDVIKASYTNKNTRYTTTKKSKKILKEIEKESNIYFFDNFKKIEEIRENLKSEISDKKIINGACIL